MTPFELTILHITPEPTTMYGLKFFPSLEPHCSNDQDTPNWGWPVNADEISECNLSVVTQIIEKLGNQCNNIVEIGVHRNNERSITHVLTRNKPPLCQYLGIDINDKREIDNISAGIHTICANSHDKVTIRKKIRDLGMKSIDILMIDGWHSVHTCINDWGYTNLLSPRGVVILHDTNAHPGSVALYHAIDEQLFDKTRYCTEINDMGIAVCWRKTS